MPREKAQAAPTVRLKVQMGRRGADCLVVATKWGNAHGAKGVGHRRGARANWVKPGGARRFSGRRQPSRGDTSRMNREVQVRICEGLGVKFPGPTRPTLPTWALQQVVGYLTYTGRDANVVAKAALDPKLPSCGVAETTDDHGYLVRKL